LDKPVLNNLQEEAIVIVNKDNIVLKTSYCHKKHKDIIKIFLKVHIKENFKYT